MNEARASAGSSGAALRSTVALIVHLWRATPPPARVAAALLLLFALPIALRLGARPRHEVRATFPRARGPVTLPLRASAPGRPLEVDAELRIDDRSIRAPMIIDTGATGITLPMPMFLGLGASPLSDVRVRTEDARGQVRELPAGELSELRLGALPLTDVVVALGETPILGQAVLAHAPWSLDWRARTLTLDAVERPLGLDWSALPLSKDGDVDLVTVEVAGKPVSLVLDLGALISTLDPAAASAIGLAAVPLGRPVTLHSAHGERVIRSLFLGDARLGERSIRGADGEEGFAFAPLSVAADKPRRAGLLGLDALGQFCLFVEPGQRLWIAPRPN
jgi:predicted aspartyl protease